MEDLVKWDWSSVLWPFWIAYALAVVGFFFAVALFLFCCYQFCHKVYSFHVVFTSFWQIWIILTVIVGAGYQAIDLVIRLDYSESDDPEQETTELSYPAWIPSLVFSLLVAISYLSTIGSHKWLVQWYEKLLYSDEQLLNIFLTEEERMNPDLEPMTEAVR